jgi:hypothetical protein
VPQFANEHSYENLVMGHVRAWKGGVRTVSKSIDRRDESIGHGDLSGAFRNQLGSLREQTEAVEAEFQEIEARIKHLERVRRSSSESNANSRKHRSLKQIVGLWRTQRTKRRTVTAVGVRPVIPVYDQRGDFSGFLTPLETAVPSAPDSISEGPVHSPSLAKQQTRRQNT